MSVIIHEIENTHVVWFEKSNQWVKFDEPQWFIFCLYRKAIAIEDAIKQFSAKFPSHQKSLVTNVYESVAQLLSEEFEIPDFTSFRTEVKDFILSKKKTYHYRYQDTFFAISYGSREIRNYIHIPFAYLETTLAGTNPLEFELFPFRDGFAMRAPGSEHIYYFTSEITQIKRLLFIELISLFFQKESDQWLSFIHGAGVAKSGKGLILSSASGQGKSTMAGILMTQNFDFFSDDFIGVDTENGACFPFPAALCLKNDAISLLNEKGLHLPVTTWHDLAFVTPEKISVDPLVIQKFVFIHYRNQGGVKLEKLTQLEALELFLQEAWVGNTLEMANRFIDWFQSLMFYRLTYDNDEQGIQAIELLINEDE